MMGETKKDRIQLLVRRFFLFLTDTFLLNACVYLSLIMRFDVGIVSIEPQYISNYVENMLPYTIMSLLIFWLFRLYHSLWQYASIAEVYRIAEACIIVEVVHFLSNKIAGNMLPRSCYFNAAIYLIIAICAALIGIVIGFLIAIVRSNHDKTGKMKVLNFLCNIYLTVIRGTPTMVQLLIIYYVIFSSVHINKIVVALLAFGINSGAYVAEIFRSGIMSIDNGQFEAARSLGLNYRQTMIQVILPQAFKNVLPALANEFIVLLKETSISGYIGLNDLTRGGDIIRSITYDPMLPLIGVAIIYLVMVMGLSQLVKKLERRLRNNER